MFLDIQFALLKNVKFNCPKKVRLTPVKGIMRGHDHFLLKDVLFNLCKQPSSHLLQYSFKVIYRFFLTVSK